MVNKIVIDLDNTITIDSSSSIYIEKQPNIPVIRSMKKYKEQGFEICIFTARNMATYDGDLNQIEENTLPIIKEWLKKYDVPYDEIIIGKPWCGSDGFYVDDKAIRPEEFAKLPLSSIRKLIK